MEEPPRVSGGFYSWIFLGSLAADSWGILRAEVFNMFVENAVEKARSTFVSDSLRDASTLCTEAGAGTFVVQLASK